MTTISSSGSSSGASGSTSGSALKQEIERYAAANPKSAAMHERAKESLPGGDSRNSIWWKPFPIYVARGDGSMMTDLDGNQRVDFISNMTTLILGHRHPDVIKAVEAQVDRGLSYPAPSELVVEWAELIVGRVPSVEKVRFVNSGTEATLNAIRAARAFTGRQKIVKCEGGYHGAHDDVAVSVDPGFDKAGDELAPESVRDYEGVPDKSLDHTIVIPYNNPAAAEAIIRANGSEVAAVIVEPVIGRLGMLPAQPEFLQALRDVTRELGIVLIFDEVISLRISPGGSQEYFGITPDMTAMGKIIGGGLPVGAFGGKSEIMALFDPDSESGPRVKHAGTFNGNPMTAAAGIATLRNMTPELYDQIAELGEDLRSKLRNLIAEREAPMGVTGIASLFSLQFTTVQIVDYRSLESADKTLAAHMFIGMLNEGFVLSTQCAGNISAVITPEQVDEFVAALSRVLERAGYG
ncbi:MAG: aspartate aminotransferase family protein [Chloroflexi bacterium]|nr:aspartate aminotransferase family protein [Chloroflexota bacterium]